MVEFWLLLLCMMCRGGKEIGLEAFYTCSGYIMRYKVKCFKASKRRTQRLIYSGALN